jgi:peptide/nickel transport system permease protein
MTRYIGSRLAALLPILLGVAAVSFSLVHIMPGDPLDALLGPQATLEQRDAFAAAMGLDGSVLEQFGTWLRRALGGDLGRSIAFGRPVAELVVGSLRNTMILASAAAVVGLLAGSVIGTVAALHRGRLLDRAVTGLSLVGLSIPSFWLAMMLVAVFGVMLRALPVSGIGTGGGADLARHLVLPTLAVSAPVIGMTARMVRTHVVEILDGEHVEFLRANGMSGPRLLLQVWRNALPSVLTVFGLELGNLLGGSALVEIVFSWPGVGQLVYQAVTQRDIPVIQAALLLVGLVYVVINLAVDVGQTVLDPRRRSQVVSA